MMELELNMYIALCKRKGMKNAESVLKKIAEKNAVRSYMDRL